MTKKVFVLVKDSGEIMVFSEKTALAKELGVSYRTVLRNIEDGYWRGKSFSVHLRTVFPQKSSRGNRKARFY
jgi:hypothetical protein